LSIDYINSQVYLQLQVMYSTLMLLAFCMCKDWLQYYSSNISFWDCLAINLVLLLSASSVFGTSERWEIKRHHNMAHWSCVHGLPVLGAVWLRNRGRSSVLSGPLQLEQEPTLAT